MRDAGISVVASILLGTLAILLYDLLTRPARQPDDQTAYPVTYNQIFQNTPPALQDPSHHQPAGILLPPVTQLTPRELSAQELERLYKSADDTTQLLIVSLINGLSFEEALNLKWKHIGLDTNALKIPGPSTRTIQLTKRYRSVFEKSFSSLTDPEALVFQNLKGDVVSADVHEAYIAKAAQSAQIDEPEKVTAGALRHTYISFLARQGVTFSDIVERVGYIPKEYHAVYDIMRPPGSGISISDVEIDFPVLWE